MIEPLRKCPLIEKDVDQLIRKQVLQNAVEFGGKAQAGSVVGKVLSERPDLKVQIQELIPKVAAITKELNHLPFQEQKKLLDALCPEPVAEGDKTAEKVLPPLPNVEKYRSIHVRFSPNPDGALHLGGARAALLCDEYAKIYKGRFTLRFDDTDPRTKFPLPEAYDWIVKDLDWLGVTWHSTIYQSDRLELYYGYAQQLIELGVAYVCTCNPPEFKTRILEQVPCPCRDLSPDIHLMRWTQMLNHTFGEGKAVVRMKTDLHHPNPAVREWPAFRIVDADKYPHPRTGTKYRVWPLFAFCCGIDDHDLQISHIIRGKEHLTNTVRQLFLYDYLHWEYPEVIHYGRLKIVGTLLSKSKIKEGVLNGTYTGWDDPRLGTLMALHKRGFLPQTIRHLIIDVGPKPVDATISWDNIQAINRKLLDPVTDRYFFVAHPVLLHITNVARAYISKLLLHPGHSEQGNRILTVTPEDGLVTLFISKSDLPLLQPNRVVRLMGLFNITIIRVDDHVEAEFHSETYGDAKRVEASLIHWIPHDTGIKTSIIMPDASSVWGLGEDGFKALQPGTIVQFERFGFVRVDKVVDGSILAYYAHR